MRNNFACVPDISSIVTNSGCRKKVLYVPKFNGSRISLISSGTVDVQDSINSYAPFTDFRYMLSCLKRGDRSVLSVKAPIFDDFTGLPNNPVDTINLIHDVQKEFNKFPEEVRSKHNNDWRVFFSSFISSRNVAKDSLDQNVGIPSNSVSTGVKE